MAMPGRGVGRARGTTAVVGARRINAVHRGWFAFVAGRGAPPQPCTCGWDLAGCQCLHCSCRLQVQAPASPAKKKVLHTNTPGANPPRRWSCVASPTDLGPSPTVPSQCKVERERACFFGAGALCSRRPAALGRCGGEPGGEGVWRRGCSVG